MSLKILLLIPVFLSIKAAITLKDKINLKRSIDFMVIGSIAFALGEMKAQDTFQILGLSIFFYGLGIVTYDKFKEGLNST